VVARSFARIFYRNAINIGLPVVEVSDHAIENEHLVEVDLENGTVTDKDTGQTYRATQMPEVMVNILNEGGLVHYLRKYGQL
jgi:3-isopropylmalate/(R)-2-methylmalate dehydratase small subunit